MNRSRLVFPLLVTLLVALVAPLSSSAGEPAPPEDAAERGPVGPPEPAQANVGLKLKGVQNGKVKVGNGASVLGTVRPFVAGQQVRVAALRGNKVIKRKTVRVRPLAGTEIGKFELSVGNLMRSGKYRFTAQKLPSPEQEGARERTRSFTVDYPDLDPGQRNGKVGLLNKLLRKRGYYTSGGSSYDAAMQRAVLAYRKVNNMARTTNATQGIFRSLANGKGGFNLKWPRGGKHVEVDLSRQVMVLAKRGKVKHIFHVSTGAPATPTVRGKFATYRKDYGTNSKGMIHSVYFHGGYATHGYSSVPTYPASHGCVRNPPPNSNFIYRWIDIGDVFYVYP